MAPDTLIPPRFARSSRPAAAAATLRAATALLEARDRAAVLSTLSEQLAPVVQAQGVTAQAEVLDAFVALAEELAAAKRAARLDGLTGCLNHVGFHERLREEVARAARSGGRFTLVLFDLEDFKDVNERFGHLAGDSVLRSVGALLRSGVRVQDQVARFGGDEFALILPETGKREALQLVVRLSADIAAMRAPGERPVHAHAGVAEWRPGEPPTGVMERADRRLRQAKRARRG